MTLRAFYHFEDTAVPIPEITLGTSSISASGARTGSRCFGPASSGTTTISPPGLSAAHVFIGFAWFQAGFAATNCFRLQEGSTAHVGVGVDATGHITIYGVAGTVVATSTAIFPTSAYAYLEIEANIADSGGTVVVKVDGTSVVSFTGDTKNGGTGVIDTIRFSAVSGVTCRIDDMYILDSAGSSPFNTFLGDVAVRQLLPDGNGASSDFVGSDGNSVNNYQQVDENPSVSTDYNGASAASKADFYTLTDIPTTDLPLAWQISTYAAKSDAGTPPVLKPSSRGDGTTIVDESAITLSTTYQVFKSSIHTTDPDGDTLTATNVNGMQVGARTS